ncbi:MAG: aminotransferase class IV, partial [Limisphaerales bacterium]
MHVFLNGQFVADEQARVSVFDRGFLYGDGLFETLRVYNGQPFRWEKHWKRFERGADFLKIKIPFSPIQIEQFLGQLIAKNKMPEAILRMNLSRGRGSRGYSPKGAERPTFVLCLHD